MTWRELIYMIIDVTKQISDDSQFNEDHIMFLCSKYRNYILNQQYLTNKKTINEANYQTVVIPLTPVNNDICMDVDTLLRSVDKLPHIMTIGKKEIYPTDIVYNRSKISFVNESRFPYVGSEFSKNIIYATIAADNYLYLKSQNTNFIYLKCVTVKALFEDIQKVAALDSSVCGCDIMDTRFPLEDAWVNTLINLVVNDLIRGINMLRDTENNSFSDTDQLAQAIQNYTNNRFHRLMQGNKNNDGQS